MGRIGSVLTHPVTDFKREAYINSEAKPSDPIVFSYSSKKAKSFYISIITKFFKVGCFVVFFFPVVSAVFHIAVK